jgi:hypothetical protein
VLLKGGDLAAAQAMEDLSCTNYFVNYNMVEQLVNQPPQKETTDPNDQKPPAWNDPSGRLAKGRCINLSSKRTKKKHSTHTPHRISLQ